MAEGQYFLKDKKAMIYKRSMVTAADDWIWDTFKFSRDRLIADLESGQQVELYFPVAESPVWCYTKQLNANNAYAVGVSTEGMTRLFVFNHCKNIENRDLILYKHKQYVVTRVDTTDDYNGETFVYAEYAKVKHTLQEFTEKMAGK